MGTAGGNGDIHINQAINRTDNNTFTLTAERDININSLGNITKTNAGAAGMTMTAGRNILPQWQYQCGRAFHESFCDGQRRRRYHRHGNHEPERWRDGHDGRRQHRRHRRPGANLCRQFEDENHHG